MKDINQLATQFIEGEWLWNKKDNILKKTFATQDELAQLNLVDKDGYLDPKLKAAIVQALGDALPKQPKGGFGDNDIFSGDILDDTILYNIELHEVSEETIEPIKNIPNLIITLVEIGA